MRGSRSRRAAVRPNTRLLIEPQQPAAEIVDIRAVASLRRPDQIVAVDILSRRQYFQHRSH